MAFQAFVDKCKAAGLSDAAIAAFKHNYDQLVAGATGLIPESEITAVSELPKLDDLKDPNLATIKNLLGKTVVLKLNGGLGTSMGLEKAKSLLVVKDGRTFIDLIAEQVKHMRAAFDSKVEFILMNSFSTSDDTKAFLKASPHADLLQEPHIELVQNKSPKVDAATLQPATYPENPENEWCPPGHGDIYPSLLGSGMLDKLVSSGKKYLFVSNSDNLGATLDLKLLTYFAESEKPFLMEVCERTAADKKGGHLCIRNSDQKFMLRESAMCPDGDKPAFEDITKHKFFNTNNLWVDLEQLQKELTQGGGALKLPLIKNKKTVNPRDSKSTPVFQLETAMGSAIECFTGAGAVVVPRSRFAPVKTCSDLLLLRSDCYRIAEDATVEATVTKYACLQGVQDDQVAKFTTTELQMPLVKLDDAHYKLVDNMEALIPQGNEPSLSAAEALTVKGPVAFDKGVIVKGSATLVCNGPEPAQLRPGDYTGEVVLESSKVAVPA